MKIMGWEKIAVWVLGIVTTAWVLGAATDWQRPDSLPGRNFVSEAWKPYQQGFEWREDRDGTRYLHLRNDGEAAAGAIQKVTLPKPEKGVWRFSCRTRNQNGVTLGESFPYYYGIRVDATLADGTSFHELQMDIPRQPALPEWTSFSQRIHIPREVASFVIYVLLWNEAGEVDFADVKFELLEPEFESFAVTPGAFGADSAAVRAYSQEADHWNLLVTGADGRKLTERSGSKMPLRLNLRQLPAGEALTFELTGENDSNGKRWREKQIVTIPPDVPEQPALVWTENSMERIYPGNLPRRTEKLHAAELVLAGGEHEAFQLLIATSEKELNDLSVTFGDFATADGQTLPKEIWRSYPVGYFFAADQLRHPGVPDSIPDWTPEALLPLDTFSVPDNFARAVWIDCAMPEGTLPGEYHGTVTVAGPELPETPIEVTLEVLPVTLPRHNSLPTIFVNHSRLGDSAQPKKFYPAERIPALYAEINRFIAGYRLSPVCYWDEYLPDFDRDIAPVADQLDSICVRDLNAPYLGFVWEPEKMVEPTAEAIAEYRKKLAADVGPLWKKIQAAGLADRAYFVGFDEVHKSKLGMVKAYFEAAKAEFPEIPIISTLRIARTDEAMKAIALDNLCIFLPRYDFTEAENLRAAGHQVWAYVMASIPDLYPQFNLHNPLIDSRILPWMAYAQKMDGLLYWGVNIWWPHHGETAIDPAAGPLMNWYSNFNNYSPWIHGDGRLCYPGVDGPIASLRLYNLRDGLEDFEYLKLYEAKFGAEAARKLAREIAPATDDYTLDPFQVYRVRREIARALSRP